MVLLAAAAIVLIIANSTIRALHRERRLVDVHRAFRYLCGEGELAGRRIVAGGYLGFALDFVNQLDVNLPEQRVIRSVCAAIAAVVLLVGGLLLERACRIPRDDDPPPR